MAGPGGGGFKVAKMPAAQTHRRTGLEHNAASRGVDLMVGGPVAKMPPMILCYICGEKFGSKSISIHDPRRRLYLAERRISIIIGLDNFLRLLSIKISVIYL